MNKTILATFGWTEAPVISSILRHGLSNGDKLILITPERRDERGEHALQDLKVFIKNYVESVEVSELCVSVDDPAASISKLKRAIEDERGRKCIVNLSGGMRAIVLFTYIATLLVNHPDIVIELETEDRRAVVEVPRLKLADLTEAKRLPHVAKEVMKELLLGPLRAASLREKLNVSASTFHSAQMKLLERGYITREKEGRTFVLKPTPLGRLLAELMGG